mgnify:CR=1 FL=1
MSHIEDVNIQWQDTGNIDAFGRARVSELTTQFDAKQIYNALPLFIDTEISGTGTVAHDSAESSSVMTTSATSDYAISQTKQRFNYQSGKSQLIFMTCNNFEAETNVTKKIGYYSSSLVAPYNTAYDGIFFESAGKVSINIWKRGVLTEQTLQEDWNIDVMDGTGKSGITIDWSKNIIFIMDFEWLGVGRVRWGVVIDGLIMYVHESNHANNTTGVYMLSPNQPLRWEIRQSGAGSGSFSYVCASVNSEGSINALGKVIGVNNGITHINANSTASTYVIHSVRLNSSNFGTLIDILNFNTLSITNDNFLWSVVLNPTITGALTYTSITNSSIQHAVGSTQTITGGTVLDSGYVSANSSDKGSIKNAIRLGATIAGVADQLVFAVRPLSTNLDILGSVNWRELI